MMTKFLYAKDIVNKKTQSLLKKCEELTKNGLRPRLDILLVGENPASELYVKNKQKACEQIGAEFNLIRLPLDVSEEVFLNKVNEMNNNPLVTGCFVQMPIPAHLNGFNITELINPLKDVDGFHSQNIIALYNNQSTLVSCTPKGIVNLLKENEISLEGKNVVVIGRGFIVGKPLALILQNENATVTVCHSKTKNIKEHTKNADIIICAIGKANFLDASFLNPNNKQVLIDVGINKDSSGALCGDINFEAVKDKVSAITPVPGGVGPMTVHSLIENLLQATEIILNSRK